MAYTDYATYMIFFHDRNEYDFAVAAVGGTPETGGMFDGSPVNAANFFGIVYPGPGGNMDLIPSGIVFNSGFHPGKELNNFAPPSVIMNDTDDEFLVPGYPGSPGFAAPGQPRIIRWSGVIVYMQGAAATTPIPTPIAARRWVMGFEVIHGMEGASGNTNGTGSREASRTIDGVGFPIRGGNGSTQLATQRMSDYGVVTHKSWERMYVRLRAVGTGIVSFWRARGSSSPASGGALVINTSGQLCLYTINAGSAITLQATGPTLNFMEWYKIDVIFRYAQSAPDVGICMVFLNGALIINFTDSSGSGFDSQGNHNESNYGKGGGISALGSADTQFEMDIDDCFNAAWPENVGVLMFDGLDFLTGSHMRRTFCRTATQVNWTPASSGQIINQGQNPEHSLNSELTATVASSLIEGTVDIPPLGEQDKFGEVAIGPVAAVVGVCSRNSGVGDGQLGYSVAGGGAVMSTVVESTVFSMFGRVYGPSGLIEPAEINPFKVRYTKSADAIAAFVRGLQAVIEYLGIWGPEDCIDPTLYPSDRPRTAWLHNCNYPNTPYGLMGPTLDSLVFTKLGTYVGNGTQQDITLPDACHMIFIRGLTPSDTNGTKWLACSFGAHKGTTDHVVANSAVRVWYDSLTGTFKLTVCGANVSSNQNAITYQYIAFCDPGMRFTCAGAYSVINNQARTHELQNPDFTPEYMIVQKDILNANSNANGTWVKGPGNVGGAGNTYETPSSAVDFGTFAAGGYTNGATVTDTQLIQFNYLAFRSVEPNCSYVMVQIMSYVGNGVSPRTINLTPASNRFPAFVLVNATSGAQGAYFRDPSHVGTNSSRFNNPSTNDSNGITGAPGIDQISVGSNLNQNGVTYNVLCFPGDATTAFLNGTYFPPNCDNPDAFFNPPMVPPEIAILAEGGLTLNGTVPLTLLKDVSGIYTLVPGKTNDTLYDRQTGQAEVDVEIPDPTAKTGFIGG